MPQPSKPQPSQPEPSEGVLELANVKFTVGVTPQGHASLSANGTNPFRLTWRPGDSFIKLENSEQKYVTYCPLTSVAWMTVLKAEKE